VAIYVFYCRRCETEFEFMKIRSDEVVECPKCEATGEKHLEKKLPTKVSHSLKGGGWYRDGYSGRKKK
jgi:putative FmdB family regulatory protein